MRRLLRALLVSAALSSAAFASGWAGVRADYHVGSGFSIYASVEQTLLEVGNFEFVGGLEIRAPSTDWQPYSAINAYFDRVFLQFKWGTKWLSLQLTYRW